jgi:hypothetical protein
MKEMKKLNVVLALMVVAVFALLSLSPLKAYADTVTMTFEYPGGQSSGGDYVYPYNFSINGSTTTIPLMCLSFTTTSAPVRAGQLPSRRSPATRNTKKRPTSSPWPPLRRISGYGCGSAVGKLGSVRNARVEFCLFVGRRAL